MTARETSHGKVVGYRYHGCRCADCTEAQRVAMADYYERYPEQREKKAASMRRLRASA